MLNMNDRVSVRLTAYGFKVLDDYESDLVLPIRHRRLSVTESNLWTGPLWELMQEFGPCIRMGMGEVPFEGNRIEVVTSVESELEAMDILIDRHRLIGPFAD